MVKLIDADALIVKYGKWYTEEGTEEGFIGTLKSLIDEQPTVEAEPVRHGRWIPVDPDKYDFATEWCCSECDKDVFVTWYGKECDYGYCPNCGARMDGGK